VKQALILSATVIVSYICVLSCNSETRESPVIIGATMSQSGSYSTQGVAAKNGYLLCQDHTNEQGGVLGRDIEFLIYDDESEADTAIRLYEQLITEDQVDVIMGPYGSTLTEAVAPVTERHRMVHISPLAATASIWEQGREFLFMVLPPAELFLAGLIEMADEHGLERVAILQEDQLFPRAAGGGAAKLAEEKGLDVVFSETYPSGTDDFSEWLATVRDENVQVLAMAASALDDFITVAGQMKEMDINPDMFGTSGAVTQFRDALGEDAEFIYGLSAWEPTLPYPGIDEFTEAYRRQFDMEPSFHAAGAYASCQIFMEAIRNTESLDSGQLREELLNLETQTILSEYAVDERGYQTANRGLFIQWQNGEKVIVWPDDLAVGEAWFPTPSWGER
jgi:branched-chain amino acid transport system substrate-binding protein